MANNLTLDGEKLIKEFESLQLKAYKCPAGKWTISWGDTQNVKEGDVITIEQAQERFNNRIKEFETCVSKCVKVPLTDNQFSALVSLCYNIGCNNFRCSTLVKYLNKGWYDEAKLQILRWDKVKGESMGGLHNRRVAEIKLWEKKDE